MNPRLKGKGRYLLAGAALIGGLWWITTRPRAAGDSVQSAPASESVASEAVASSPVERVVPEGTRVRVEVLNGTAVRGLARRATRAMRDAGFDVVASGNGDAEADSSVVYVRSGRMDWGAWAVTALGGARLIARPDTSRDLDLTIVVGRRWRPPPEPFNP